MSQNENLKWVTVSGQDLDAALPAMTCTLTGLGELPTCDQEGFGMVTGMGLESSEVKDKRKHNHYFKDVSHLDYIDIYRILELYGVRDPSLQHIVKKALCTGIRGAKNLNTDKQEILDTAVRMMEMVEEDSVAQEPNA